MPRADGISRDVQLILERAWRFWVWGSSGNGNDAAPWRPSGGAAILWLLREALPEEMGWEELVVVAPDVWTSSEDIDAVAFTTVLRLDLPLCVCLCVCASALHAPACTVVIDICGGWVTCRVSTLLSVPPVRCSGRRLATHSRQDLAGV